MWSRNCGRVLAPPARDVVRVPAASRPSSRWSLRASTSGEIAMAIPAVVRQVILIVCQVTLTAGEGTGHIP